MQKSHAVEATVHALKRMALSNVARAWRQWSATVDTAQQKETGARVVTRVFGGAVKRMGLFQLGRAWRQWSGTVDTAQQQEVGARVTVRVLIRMQSASLSSGYNTWRSWIAAVDRISLRKDKGALLMQQVAKRMSSARLGSGLTTWRLAVRDLERSGERRQLATTVMVRGALKAK